MGPDVPHVLHSIEQLRALERTEIEALDLSSSASGTYYWEQTNYETALIWGPRDTSFECAVLEETPGVFEKRFERVFYEGPLRSPQNVWLNTTSTQAEHAWTQNTGPFTAYELRAIAHSSRRLMSPPARNLEGGYTPGPTYQCLTLLDFYVAKTHGILPSGQRSLKKGNELLFLVQDSSSEDDLAYGLRALVDKTSIHDLRVGRYAQALLVGSAWMRPLTFEIVHTLSRVRRAGVAHALALLPAHVTKDVRADPRYSAWLFRYKAADKHLEQLLRPPPAKYCIFYNALLRMFAQTVLQVLGEKPRHVPTDLVERLWEPLVERCLDQHPAAPTRALVIQTLVTGISYLRQAGVVGGVAA